MQVQFPRSLRQSDRNEGQAAMKRFAAAALRYLYSAVCSVYLFSFGVFSAKHRRVLWAICAHFGYCEVRPIIPTVKVSQVVPDDASIQMREPIGIDGSVSPLELMVIAKMVRFFNPRTLFEIGTLDGRTTLNLAANCSPNARVYTLDLPKEELKRTKLTLAPGDRGFIEKDRSGSRFQGTDVHPRITQLFGDSATFDFSPFYNSVDFVFIDGSHSYPYVLNDSKVVLRLLRNGKGVILWHDYAGWEGVTRALNELFSQTKEFQGLRRIEHSSLVYLMAK